MLLSAIIFSSSFLVNGQEKSPNILIIYSKTSEITSFQTSVQNLPFSPNIDTKKFSEVAVANIGIYDLVILLSSVEFDIPEKTEDELTEFLKDQSKIFIGFSPYLDRFENEIELLLGFEEIGDIIPEDLEDGMITWTLRVDESFGNISAGENFNYTGYYSEIEPLESTKSIVSIISDDTSENEEVEHPAILNATNTGAYVISSTLSPISIDNKQSLSLNQLPKIFDTLITQLFSSILIEANKRSFTGTNINSTQVSDQPNTSKVTESKGIFDRSFPIFQNIQNLDFLVYGLILFLLLFLTKLTRVYGWFSRKLIGIGIFVIGIFYNVEDRILAHKDVYLNNSRAEIMDFLDTVGQFGSHLREIKSKTNLASGSLMWHLKVLEDFNWIMKYKIENNTIYVSHNFESSFDPYLKKLEMKLHSKYTYDLLNALKNVSYNNSITIIDIQKQVDIPNKAIRRLINKMHELEIVKINYTKPIRFQIYNFSIFNNICESLDLRENYEMIVNNN